MSSLRHYRTFRMLYGWLYGPLSTGPWAFGLIVKTLTSPYEKREVAATLEVDVVNETAVIVGKLEKWLAEQQNAWIYVIILLAFYAIRILIDL